MKINILTEREAAPCPFCGKSDLDIRAVRTQNPHLDGHQIYCKSRTGTEATGCGAGGPICLSDELALEEWNRRASEVEE